MTPAMENIEVLEVVWTTIALFLVTMCVLLAVESWRDRAVVKRRSIHGPLRLVADVQMIGSLVRVAVALIILGASLLSAVHPRPEALTVWPFQWFRPLWITMASLLTLHVVVDRRCRGRLRQYLEAAGTRKAGRRATDVPRELVETH